MHQEISALTIVLTSGRTSFSASLKKTFLFNYLKIQGSLKIVES